MSLSRGRIFAKGKTRSRRRGARKESQGDALFFPHGRNGRMDVYGRKNEWTDERTSVYELSRPAGSTIRGALATSQHAPERGSISRLGATRRSAPRCVRLGSATLAGRHRPCDSQTHSIRTDFASSVRSAASRDAMKRKDNLPRREIFIEIF